MTVRQGTVIETESEERARVHLEALNIASRESVMRSLEGMSTLEIARTFAQFVLGEEVVADTLRGTIHRLHRIFEEGGDVPMDWYRAQVQAAIDFAETRHPEMRVIDADDVAGPSTPTESGTADYCRVTLPGQMCTRRRHHQGAHAWEEV